VPIQAPLELRFSVVFFTIGLPKCLWLIIDGVCNVDNEGEEDHGIAIFFEPVVVEFFLKVLLLKFG